MLVATSTTMLEAALEYARMSWPVHPLHTPQEGGCSCNKRGCESIGKHPRTQRGRHDATTNEDQIRKWWSQWPEANIGLNCEDAGLLVVDIDPRNGGDDSYTDLVRGRADRDRWINTVTNLTGGGGYHLVFKRPRELGRGDGATTSSIGQGIDIPKLIVLPPSLHISGEPYHWEADHSPEDQEPQLPPPALTEIVGRRDASVPNEGERLETTAEILQGVDEPGRKWALYRLASRFRYADIPFDAALELIQEAAAKCRPPLPPHEAERKVREAYHFAAGATAAVVAGNDESPHAEGLAGLTLIAAHIDGGVPVPEWLIEGVLLKGCVTLLHGEPGCGKTFLALGWMLDLVEQNRRVMFIDEESGPVLVGGRFAAMGAVGKKVDHVLHYYAFPGIAFSDSSKVIEAVASFQPELVVFDALADMLVKAGLDENSNAEVTQWMDALPVSIAQSGAAVLLLDHDTKDQANTNYSRGAGAKRAKADVQWRVVKRTEFDANTVGRVQLQRGKNRPGVVPETSMWSVGGNGETTIVEPFSPDRHNISTYSETERRVLAALEEGPLRPAQLREITGLKRTAIAAATTQLVARGAAFREGSTNATTYVLTRPANKSIQPANKSNPAATRPGEGGRPYGASPPVELRLDGGADEEDLRV